MAATRPPLTALPRRAPPAWTRLGFLTTTWRYGDVVRLRFGGGHHVKGSRSTKHILQDRHRSTPENHYRIPKADVAKDRQQWRSTCAAPLAQPAFHWSASRLWAL